MLWSLASAGTIAPPSSCTMAIAMRATSAGLSAHKSDRVASSTACGTASNVSNVIARVVPRGVV